MFSFTVVFSSRPVGRLGDGDGVSHPFVVRAPSFRAALVKAWALTGPLYDQGREHVHLQAVRRDDGVTYSPMNRDLEAFDLEHGGER